MPTMATMAFTDCSLPCRASMIWRRVGSANVWKRSTCTIAYIYTGAYCDCPAVIGAAPRLVIVIKSRSKRRKSYGTPGCVCSNSLSRLRTARGSAGWTHPASHRRVLLGLPERLGDCKEEKYLHAYTLRWFLV